MEQQQQQQTQHSSNKNSNPVLDSEDRPYIFIDASDPITPNRVIPGGGKKFFFRPPFPPILDLEYFVTKKRAINDKTPTKPPNAFIIYRRAFIKTAITEGYKLPMTIISSIASQSWVQEPELVKAEYRRLANEVKTQHELLYPKKPKQKEPRRWRAYAFKPKEVKKRKSQVITPSNLPPSPPSSPEPNVSPSPPPTPASSTNIVVNRPVSDSFDLKLSEAEAAANHIEHLSPAGLEPIHFPPITVQVIDDYPEEFFAHNQNLFIFGNEDVVETAGALPEVILDSLQLGYDAGAEFQNPYQAQCDSSSYTPEPFDYQQQQPEEQSSFNLELEKMQHFPEC